MSQKLKVAIVGAGSMAREHIRAFRDISNVEVAGIFSRTRTRAEALAKEFEIPLVCESVNDLYAKTQAGLVVITVVELSMEAVAEAAFAHPWTILLEKPVGYTVEIAERIAKSAHAKKRQALVALNRRFYSSTQQTLGRLRENVGPRYIRVQDQQDLQSARSSGQPEAVVQNWMYANSIHVIDYFRVLGRGKVTNVRNITRWNPQAPGLLLAEIHFDSGDIGIYEGVWNGPGPWAVTVSTPTERFEMRPLEQLTFQLRGERKLNPAEIHVHDTAYKAGFRRQAEEAVAAALGTPHHLPTLDEGIESMRLVQQIFAEN